MRVEVIGPSQCPCQALKQLLLLFLLSWHFIYALCNLKAGDQTLRFFLNSLWTRILVFEGKQLLELAQLPLKTHVWKDNRTFLASEGERFLKCHVLLLH